MKIITLSLIDYKEKDAIVTAVSEEGPISFKVRGIKSPTSHFAWMNNPLSVAEVEYVENVRYKHQILKAAKMVDSPLTDSTYLRISAIQLVTEIMLKMLPEEDRGLLFKDLESYISISKKKDEEDLYLLLLIFLAKAINASGVALEVDHCVHCQATKNIVAFSFEDGGYLCKNCFQEVGGDRDLNANQLRLLRFIFKAPIKDNLHIDNCSQHDYLVLLSKLQAYIADIIGVKLNAIDLILKNK